MSTENSNSDSDGDEGVFAPTISTEPPVHRLNASLLRGGDWSTQLEGISGLTREDLYMEQYGGERNLFSALGYVTSPDYRHYRARYARTDTAPAIVDKLPKKAWEKPTVIDTGSDGTTEFEKAAEAFLAGEYTEESPVKVMERAARMERLGNFSLIFLGLNDANASPDEDADQDVEELLSSPVDASSLEEMDPGEAISYIRPYDQGRVDEDNVEWEDEDPTDERFGKPIQYHVDLGEGRPTTNIHWSRIVHVVGNVFDDEFESPSVLKQSLNRVDDIEKILGGSAEGYWRSAYQGLVVSPPEIGGEMTEFSDSGEELHSQINRYINNFSREIFTAADVEPINVSAESPTDFLEVQYRDIAAGHDIPQSILMGNETGERATEQDLKMWHERVAQFRKEYCEPSELRPMFDLLIRWKVLPEPEGGPHGYRFIWPPLDEKTEKEEWDVRQTIANTLQVGTGGTPMSAVSMAEFRKKVLGWDPEVGSEVESGGEAMEPAEPDDLVVDEEDGRVQEQYRELQARLNEINEDEISRIVDKDNPTDDEVDKLRVVTEDGLRGFIVDILTEGFDVEEATVEASEEEPKYVVITESESKPHVYATADELEQEQWESGIDDPTEELGDDEEEESDRENSIVRRAVLKAMGRTQQEGHFEWPESWKESDKPARLIAMDAWLSMGARHGGGSPGGCTSTMRGHIVDPDRFCADFKDRIYMWDYWRGDSWAPGD